MNYLDIINHYPDFPKKGIDFIDILPFLHKKEAFKQVVADIDAHVHCPNVATVEARGFLFAAPLLTQSALVQNIIPIRKKGKLPFSEGDLRGVEIEKEYGSLEPITRRLVGSFNELKEKIHISESLNKETISLEGKTYKVKVKEFLFLVEFPDLYDHERINAIAPVHSFAQVAGD